MQVQSILLVLASFATAVAHSRAAELTAEKTDRGVTIKADGKLFAEYLVRSGNKPAVWPVIGPTGKAMTRAYPMNPSPPDYEKRDHVHHRSLWFTHGEVNGVDFWSEGGKSGSMVHTGFDRVEGGSVATIVARTDWVSREGKRICQDERTLRFGAGEQTRWIDFDVVVRATDGPLTFGDTKEGSFGVRVAETMKVEAKLGGKIITSEGKTDGDAWGKPAAWVDYHGPVEGEHLGIAILNHPSSFRHPTTWHVRTYGLFAANPFGLRDFSGGKTASGEHTVESGKTLTMRHRVILHKGDEKEGRIAEAYTEYAKAKK
jgi:hypothetical protein